MVCFFYTLGHRSDSTFCLKLGPACLERLNVQFAIRIWDARRDSLFLAREALGVRTFFYALLPHGVVFGSEIKAFCWIHVPAGLDPMHWRRLLPLGALAPRTAFRH
jgi:asparagine synthase (glutamine-hydrolysing)